MNKKGKVKLLWDFNFQTEKELEHGSPYIVKQEGLLIIDVAVWGYHHMNVRENVNKYGDR